MIVDEKKRESVEDREAGAEDGRFKEDNIQRLKSWKRMVVMQKKNKDRRKERSHGRGGL